MLGKISKSSDKLTVLIDFSNIEKYNDQKTSLNISDDLINQKMHTIELSNWLNYIESTN